MMIEIHDRHAHVHYEVAYGLSRHDHIICDRCARVFEFAGLQVTPTILAARVSHKVDYRTHRVEVFGTCADCRAVPTPESP